MGDSENYEITLKKFKDLNKKGNTSCSWIRVLAILKLIYRFNAVPIKMAAYFILQKLTR